MKNTVPIFLIVSILFSIGCSTVNKSIVTFTKSKKYGNEEINNLIKECLEYDSIYYHVRATTTKDKIYETLIDNQFQKLENLDLRFVKIYYNRNDILKYDCVINVLFDELTINDEKSINNKSFSKVVPVQQLDADSSTSTGSETVRGYIHQREQKRKLSWDIKIERNSEFNNSVSLNSKFTEKISSKSVHNTLSGDERAIPKKYKEAIGKSLLTESDLVKEAIINVYKIVEDQLKSDLKNML